MTTSFGSIENTPEVKLLNSTLVLLQSRIDRYRRALDVIANSAVDDPLGAEVTLCAAIEIAKFALSYEQFLEKQNG